MTALLLLACSDHVLSTRSPEVGEAWAAISVTPDHLDFWEAGLDEVVTLPFTVYSVGDVALRVASLAVEGEGSFTLPEGGASFDLPVGELREVPVAFTPLAPGAQRAEVVVRSDDPEHPELRLPLTGTGEVPRLVVTPGDHAFGALPTGCSDTVTLTLQNTGTDTLSVESWSLTGDGFSVVGDRPLPFDLDPFDYATATVTFSPTAGGAATGAFTVVSNDPRGDVVATQSGVGEVVGRGEDPFVSDPNPPTDILFAVDQSASMDDDAAGLGAALESFVDTLAAVTDGWHLGVVTLDSGCMNGGLLQSSTPDLAATFGAAVALGEDRDLLYDEALFQLADVALLETAPGGCNEGFLRDGAPLHLVFVSDEPERSTEIASVWTWDWYQDRWNAQVGAPSLLTVSGIVDTEGCGEGDEGYASLIAATGGESLSVCTPNWPDMLASLATRSLESIWTFPLSATPVPASLVVRVDGVPRTSGWRYDASLGAVVVDGLVAGQSVEVAYDLAAECP